MSKGPGQAAWDIDLTLFGDLEKQRNRAREIKLIRITNIPSPRQIHEYSYSDPNEPGSEPPSSEIRTNSEPNKPGTEAPGFEFRSKEQTRETR